MHKLKIALLGIDGSGKSTMSKEISVYLTKKGYEVKIIPFHKWVFADKLRSVFGKYIDRDRKGRDAPYSPKKKSFSSFIKPPIAFIDNLLFYCVNRPRKKNQVNIYDRFICSTQIKFKALNYHVNWFKFLWWNITPDYAIIFDINLKDSFKAQIERNDPYLYKEDQLVTEKKNYLEYAKKHNFPIITRKDIKTNFNEIIQLLEEKFL